MEANYNAVNCEADQTTGGFAEEKEVIAMKQNLKLFVVAMAAVQVLTSLSIAEGKGASAKAVPAEKAPPLPLHTIDGVGGVVITPIAYLVNPGPEGTKAGLPSISETFVNAGQKDVESFVITETLWRRVELGFSASRFGTGSLGTDVQKATGIDIARSDVWLYNLNVRALVLLENSFNLPTPAVTLGVQGKINDGISSINNNLHGALTSIGYRHDKGVDLVATASKLFPNVFHRPLIVSGSLRLSAADQLGYLGFSDTYRPSAEGNVVYLITDRLALAGEYRQKRSPYGSIGNLVRIEDDWWTIGAAYVLNNHSTVTVGYGHFGNVLNTVENTGFALSLKYEF